MPVGVLLESVSSRELTEWMAWFDYQANPPKPQTTPQDVRSALDRLAGRGGRK